MDKALTTTTCSPEPALLATTSNTTAPTRGQSRAAARRTSSPMAQYSMIPNPELYYTLTMDLPTVCEGQDEATAAIHEFTHSAAVYDTSTSDFKYGNKALLLGSEHALGNADNYTM